MRIALVNDMPIAIEVLKRAVRETPGHDIAWIATDGREAVEKCAADLPDLILMDLVMPVMDGVEATRRIMRDSPCAILVVTATVSGHAAKVFDAMGAGALDAVRTPTLGPDGRLDGADVLTDKITRLAPLIRRADPIAPIATPSPARARLAHLPPLVLVGASTGGPKALADTLGAVPADAGVAVVIAQHVDQQFAQGMRDWLAEQCSMPVRLVEPGVSPEPGVILLAGTNDHLAFLPDRTLHYTPDPADCPFRPSVDVLYRSALAHWPARGLAILLTGMGRDGAQGLLELRNAGWCTVAQDRDSSILYGMPRVAAELGAALHILPPNGIRERILQFDAESRPPRAPTHSTQKGDPSP